MSDAHPTLEDLWRDTPEALAFHDLKNHLGVALINASLLERRVDASDPRVARHLELIRQSLDAMGALSEQLREFVWLLSQPRQLKPAPLDAEALLEEALEGCRAARDGAAPKVQAQGLAGLALLGERPTTARMLSTLFVAALRESARDPGVVLGVQPEPRAVRFQLAAAALGGDEPNVPRNLLKLALATTERLVIAHGGTWGSPELAAGLRVDFTLPRAG